MLMQKVTDTISPWHSA